MIRSQSISPLANVAFMDGKPTHHSRDFLEEVLPCFQLMIFLEGEQKFYLDDRLFDIHAGYGAERRAQMLLIQRNRVCRLRTISHHGEKTLRKVKVSLPATWIEDCSLGSASPVLKQFRDEQIGSYLAEATTEMASLAEAVIQPPSPFSDASAPDGMALYRVAKGMELIAQACLVLANRLQPCSSGLQSRQFSQAERIRRHILDHLDDDLTLDSLSRQVGASKRSVQRNFKHHYGMTVTDFMRKLRLERARQAIEKQGMTIGQAAFLAGYNNTSSFSNAFKLTYGSTPKSWRPKR
ncbi:helix-turn-helix transcriptional regulator [uncultured Cohaesibacter sp.]|uniref:AraC family transcriptional regulator n=1 Tax=uncultured Cohaesibacter sp. TaxID=1002546 RepID=UPI0029C7B885|nr:helix-turn-helix transcriptional regulator [uncultured Cohaesibacter sp.]